MVVEDQVSWSNVGGGYMAEKMGRQKKGKHKKC